MTFNPFTLAFSGNWAGLEPDFLAHYHATSLVRMRVAMVVASLLYGVFGFLDAVMVPDLVHLFWLIRFAVVVPLALAVLAFSYHKAFEKYCQPALFILMFTGALGIEIMVLLAAPPVSTAYYVGITLVIITLHTFIRMRFLWATACSWTIVLCYEVIAIGLTDTPSMYLLNNNFFFISAVMLCMLANYSLELNERKRFFANHLLTLEKEKIEALNQELDLRVQERTRELSEANKRLHHEMGERLQAQEIRFELETALNKRQKSEALGTLAGGIAHDFNNILGAILGNAELIQMDSEPGDPIHDQAGEILKASLRARDLTLQILTFSRQVEQAQVPMDLKPVIQEALRLIRATVPATIRIHATYPSSRWAVCDPTQVHRMIVNLATNAAQAMAHQTGTIDLTLEDIETVAPFRVGETLLEPGPYLRLKMSDTGQGMDEKTLNQIFDPFFTTKGVSGGTGMGLSVVQGVVKKSRGAIDVKSAPGKGSTFTIFLPAIEPPSEEFLPDQEQDLEKIRGKGEQILFVDDEAALGEMMKTTLASLNYQTTWASSAKEGMDILNRQDPAIDLVITDFAMPGMTGLEFARWIKETWPQIPVILSTGFSESITKEKIQNAGISGLIMKPVTRSALGAKICQALLEKGRATRVTP